MRRYYIAVSAGRQFLGALLYLGLTLGCLSVVLEPERHLVTTGVLSILGIALFGYLAIGAFINACRVAAARFRIFFGWEK
jgi:hypothetical protein